MMQGKVIILCRYAPIEIHGHKVPKCNLHRVPLGSRVLERGWSLTTEWRTYDGINAQLNTRLVSDIILFG